MRWLPLSLGFAVVAHPAGQADIVAKLTEAAALQKQMGLPDVHVLDVKQIQELSPWLGTDGILGATCTPKDGKMTSTEGE